MTYEETDTIPLLIVSEVIKNEMITIRTFYWLNYEYMKGCLFRLPQTRLSFEVCEDRIMITNTGFLPAVAVNVSRPGHLNTFTVSDNFFWLESGERKTLQENSTDGIAVSAWNAGNYQ